MAPIFLNAAASVAGNVIHSITKHFSHHHGVNKASAVSDGDFDAELAKTQAASSVTAATPVDTQNLLMKQVLGRPEVATALAGVNPTKSVQVEMSATGDVSLRKANGESHALKVSEDTRNLAARLYSAHQGTVPPGKTAPTAILAIDPMRATAASWSNLPARTA